MRGKRLFGVALAALSSAAGGVTVAHADPTVKWNGSPVTNEEDRSFHVNGRLMYDMAYTSADHNGTGSTASAAPGTNDSFHTYARRAFIEIGRAHV